MEIVRLAVIVAIMAGSSVSGQAQRAARSLPPSKISLGWSCNRLARR